MNSATIRHLVILFVERQALSPTPALAIGVVVAGAGVAADLLGHRALAGLPAHLQTNFAYVVGFHRNLAVTASKSYNATSPAASISEQLRASALHDRKNRAGGAAAGDLREKRAGVAVARLHPRLARACGPRNFTYF